jgi:hypothetical protein
MLLILQWTRTLRFTRPGRLQPWMGPALRGLVALPFKQSVCIHPRHEQETRWRHCSGCPHMRECPFGQTFEPDPPAEAKVFRGQEQAVRPMVLALPFPMPPRVRPGDETPLTLTLIGDQAIRHAGRVWQALAEAGADPRRGFDPERTTFELGAEVSALGPETIELPLDVGEEIVERVEVELTGPLFLRDRDAVGRRRHLAQPSFADLLRASLRTLGQLFALYDQPLPADFAALKQAAESVPLRESRCTSFYQDHWSNRAGRSRPLHGVQGSAIYGPAPAALVRWLVWGGRTHVGTDRVAGSGGWRIRADITDVSRPPISPPESS